MHAATQARPQLVAIDLEGTGAQDREDEAILEIALASMRHPRTDAATAWTSLINPGRLMPVRPWISPGITTEALRHAPSLAEVEPEIVARVNGRLLVGHNVTVDWRLLHRRCPTVSPAGLLPPCG